MPEPIIPTPPEAPASPAGGPVPPSVPNPSEPSVPTPPVPSPAVPAATPPPQPPPQSGSPMPPSAPGTPAPLAVEPAPAPRPRTQVPWRTILIVLASLVALGLISGLLWWFGIGFGPPTNAQTALAKAVTALQAAASYQVQGTVEVGLGETTRQTTTKLTFEGVRATDGAQEFDLEFDLTGLGADLPAHFPTAIEVDVQRSGQRLYLQAPVLALLVDIEPTTWLATDLASGTPGLPALDQSRLSQVLGQGRRLGFERIGPLFVAHYQMSVADLSPLVDALNATGLSRSDIDASGLMVDLWIGVNNHLPYRWAVTGTLDLAGTPVGLSLTANLARFGEQLTVTPPASFTELDEAIPNLAGLTQLAVRQGRDTQRKADLANLQDALDRYRLDHGAYPVTGEAIAQTNQADSALKVLVDQAYLRSLPTDPLDPTYWYGYTSSDGTTFELWSVLEDATDPQATQRGDYTLFVLTGSSNGAPSTNGLPSS